MYIPHSPTYLPSNTPLAYGPGIFPLGEERMAFSRMIYSLIHSSVVCSTPTMGMAQGWALVGGVARNHKAPLCRSSQRGPNAAQWEHPIAEPPAPCHPCGILVLPQASRVGSHLSRFTSMPPISFLHPLQDKRTATPCHVLFNKFYQKPARQSAFWSFLS